MERPPTASLPETQRDPAVPDAAACPCPAAPLRENQERLSELVNGFAQAFWEMDAHGQVVTDSPSWRAYTGQSRQELLGYGWVDAIHPEDRKRALAHLQEAVSARRAVIAEFRVRTASA